MPTLARLRGLTELHIDAPGLTDRGKAELKRLLPNCKVVTDRSSAQ